MGGNGSPTKNSTATVSARSPVPAPVQGQLHTPLPKIRNAFAVVCDTSESGKREYPWGSLDIYDEEHSDFRRLQRLVFESNHITELRELTQQMSMVKYKPLCESGKDSKKVIRGVLYYVQAVTNAAVLLRKVLHLVMLVTCWTVLALFVLQYLLTDDTSFWFIRNLCACLVRRLTAIPHIKSAAIEA